MSNGPTDPAHKQRFAFRLHPWLGPEPLLILGTQPGGIAIIVWTNHRLRILVFAETPINGDSSQLLALYRDDSGPV
jgi:hypothetical protein